MLLLDVLISKRAPEAEGIISLELIPVEGGTLPAFDAGSHIDVFLKEGLVRQYSLYNDPDETHRYCLGVLLEPESRGGSEFIHEHFEVGQKVQISVPRNHFPLDESAKKTFLLAGGIGITPMRAMAERLHRLGADFEMHYCSRSQSRMAFSQQLQASGFADCLHLHFDDGPVEQRFAVESVLPAPDSDTHIYICGPGGFIEYVQAGAKKLGWSVANIHVEFFAADVDSSGDSFTVVTAHSGKKYFIPADKSIADVLIEAGVSIDVACEQGVCGTCMTRVIEGTPDHRDVVLNSAEKEANEQILICCSRSKSPTLVLDI